MFRASRTWGRIFDHMMPFGLHSRSFSLVALLAGLLAAALPAGATEVVYRNDEQFFGPGFETYSYRLTNAFTVTVDGTPRPAGEIADHITASRGGEFSSFSLQLYTPSRGATNTTGVLKFYANDGPAVTVPGFGSVNLPGSLLFESVAFQLISVSSFAHIITLSGVPGLVLPESFTWAIEYRDVNPGAEPVDLIVFDPPSVGSNPAYYLAQDSNRDWVIFPPAVQDGVTVPGNFGAIIEFTPIPEPSAPALFAVALTTAALVRRRHRTRTA